MDELEQETDTRKLFLEQGILEDQKQKEVQEYLDAKNKEVKLMTNILIFFLSFPSPKNQNVK